MKYKFLTKEQLIISIDRLTRFKNTKEKYLRVFSDILISNLVNPRLKKIDIQKLDPLTITNYATCIINDSLKEIFKTENTDFKINSVIRDLENNTFVNDSDTQIFLNNKIDYLTASKLIDCNSPVNLKWLLSLTKEDIINSEKLTYNREQKKLKYPIEEIILVEGITEEILLPRFSQQLGYDFYERGIQVIAAGGKNQVVKLYYKLSQETKLPIFVLLDKDAEENIQQIKPRLRKIDRIHIVSCGEFEDLLPKELIIKTVNSHFKNFLSINIDDLNNNIPTAKTLEEIFKTKGLHEFKKAEFAKLVREKISSNEDISEEIKTIIKEVKGLNK